MGGWQFQLEAVVHTLAAKPFDQKANPDKSNKFSMFESKDDFHGSNPSAYRLPAPDSVFISAPQSPDARKSACTKPTRIWTDTLKLVIYATAIIILVLLLLGIVVAAIAMLFDDDRALGRALHRWKATRNGGTNSGNAMSTNGDGDRN
uniref:Uncharacterized protein n=1 Tax=Globodera rostochiensis TaxID=31243 RepID=A0A914HRX1_GLORO